MAMTERYRAWRERNRVVDPALALVEAVFWNEAMDDSPVPARWREAAQADDPWCEGWSPACPDCGDEADPECPTCQPFVPCACEDHNLAYRGEAGEVRAWWAVHCAGEHSVEQCVVPDGDGVRCHIRAPRKRAELLAGVVYTKPIRT